MDTFLNTTCSASSLGVASSTFSSALQLLYAAQCALTENWPVQATVKDNEKFDFIIVGAGTAGSIVANRLSEIKDWNVLLIEAGGDPPIESTVPFLWRSFSSSSDYNWKYKTVNRSDIGHGFVNGSVYSYTMGKMLGGASSLNAQLYFQGNHHDYQHWYDQGNVEWHPEVAKHYSNKAEKLQDPTLLANPTVSKNYGKNGPLPINTFTNFRGTTEEMLSGFNEIGMREVRDPNSAELFGSGILTATVSGGKRVSTAKAYLNPVQKRSNLKILKETLVTKVLINKNKKAYGVQVDRQGKTQKYYATSEVVLSCGSINTPKLLMLSGIGPQKVLKGLKISSVVDAPGVGQDMQEYGRVPVTIYADEPKKDKVKEALSTAQYLYNQSGKLSESVANIVAFFSLKKNAKYADMQVGLRLASANSSDVTSAINSYVPSIKQSVLANTANKALYYFTILKLHPFSRGYVTLNSADPKDPPIINPNYLKDSRDLDNYARACKIFSGLVNTTYFKSINAYLGRMDIKECNGFELNSLDYWKCIAKATIVPANHPVGTARMGSDSKAVVDSRLRVHGVERLRVIDASVMPTITSCNTMGPTIMIGERGSDLIKEDY